MEIPTMSLQCFFLINIRKIANQRCGILKALTHKKAKKKRTVCVSARRKSKHQAVIYHLIYNPSKKLWAFYNWVYKNRGFNKPANDFVLSYCCPEQCGEIWVWQKSTLMNFWPWTSAWFKQNTAKSQGIFLGPVVYLFCLSWAPGSACTQLSTSVNERNKNFLRLKDG